MSVNLLGFSLSGFGLSGYGVTLLPVAEEHLEQLRCWRNDPAISEFMLTKEEITAEQQLSWFQSLAEKPYQKHFVISYKHKAIGAANIKEQYRQPITNKIEADNATSELKLEPGIYLGEEKFRNNVLAFAPSLVLLDYCFDELKVMALHATMHRENTAALNYNQKLGYKVVDENDEWLSIMLAPEDYASATTAIKRFLSKRL